MSVVESNMQTKLDMLKETDSTITKAANSNVVKNVERTLQKWFQDNKKLLIMIIMNVPKYAELEQVVGLALANFILVAIAGNVIHLVQAW